MQHKLLIITLFLIGSLQFGYGQKKQAEFGIVLRPIFESDAFRTGPIQAINDDLLLTIRQKSGFAYGAIIRYGLTKSLYFEGGLTITTRNISLNVVDEEYDYNIDSDFKFITYELPVNVMTKVPIRDNFFVTAAAGFVFDFLPSDLETFTPDGTFYHRTFYKSWIQGAVSANMGLEYATKNAGSIYLGASFHQPFTDLTITRIETQKRINNRNEEHTIFTNIPGSYLTFDVRYFFPENKKAPSLNK
jgi:hypothetical protein